MQSEDIILLPPTHEQSVYTFHVAEPLAEKFLKHLKNQGVSPWRPVTPQPKLAPDASPVVQIEIDVAIGEERLRKLIDSFHGGQRVRLP